MKKLTNIRFRLYLIRLYLLLLPIDAALGNILGSISIINYLIIFFVTFRLILLFKENLNVKRLVNINIPFIYFMYYIVSIIWAISSDLSKWHIFTLIASFIMFAFLAIDVYNDSEHIFLKESVYLSGIIFIIISLLSLDIHLSNRFTLSIGRYMDPNYLSTGLVLITAVIMDKILKKEHRSINLIILMLLIMIVFITGSRGGLLANITVILTFYIVDRDKIYNKIYVFLLGFIMFVLIFNFSYNYIPNWIINRFSINEILSDQGSGRIDIWLNSISYYKDLPILRLIFGTGFATFSYISLNTTGVLKVAHNIYIQSLLEGGIVGLLITIFVIINAMQNALKNNNMYVFAAIIGVAMGGLTLDIHVTRFFWNIMFFSTLPNLKSSSKISNSFN